jgi:hypothetical protein
MTRPSCQSASRSPTIRSSQRTPPSMPEHALAHESAVVDAVVARAERAMPPVVTVEMAKGFSLYMMNAIMSGRADQIIGLAKTNLWR